MAVASGTPTSTPASTDGKEVAVVSAAGGARAAVVSRVEKTAATAANMLTYQLNFNLCGYFYMLQKSPGFFFINTNNYAKYLAILKLFPLGESK